MSALSTRCLLQVHRLLMLLSLNKIYCISSTVITSNSAAHGAARNCAGGRLERTLQSSANLLSLVTGP